MIESFVDFHPATLVSPHQGCLSNLFIVCCVVMLMTAKIWPAFDQETYPQKQAVVHF